MALRVLLADESVTIKKVFQLALQDYGVEVKSVSVGTDVHEVAQQFHPDIIFADVLLQQKNGYEICQELKASSQLKDVPVVLIWSNFLELDETKFSKSGADDQLEKPFDTDRLRQIVNSLVAKTRTQKLSDFLTFPSMPEFKDDGAKPAKPPTPAPAIVLGPPPIEKAEDEEAEDVEFEQVATTDASKANDDAWNMDSFEEIQTPDYEEFEIMDLDAKPDSSSNDDDEIPTLGLDIESDTEDDAGWVQESISKFKLNPDQTNPPTEATYEPETKPLPILEPIPLAETTKVDVRKPTTPPLLANISEEQLKALITAEARKMLEKVIWEVVPELATQIIERELSKVMQDNNDSN